MSKVVKGVGRAIGNVVKGVVKVVKKVATSKIGKILIGAAALYFGVPMISGAITGASAGAAAGSGFFGTLSGAASGALSGASAGISQAWARLTGAANAAAGGNFAGAASNLMAGATPVTSAAEIPGLFGASGTGAATTGGIPGVGPFNSQGTILNRSGTLLNPVTSRSIAAPALEAASPWATSSTSLNVLASEAAPAATKGIVSSIMSSPYTAPALISGATQLVGGAMQGYGAQKQYEDQKKIAVNDRARYNTNVGTRLWG